MRTRRISLILVLPKGTKEKQNDMKTTNEHRALQTKLRNTYGYRNMKTIICKLTGEATIYMGSKEDSAEMYEIFGDQGYQFGHEVKA